jgi:hypothetical protein
MPTRGLGDRESEAIERDRGAPRVEDLRRVPRRGLWSLFVGPL